ncbi:unnamed protein product, partial [Iphiclides podalirius]
MPEWGASEKSNILYTKHRTNGSSLNLDLVTLSLTRVHVSLAVNKRCCVTARRRAFDFAPKCCRQLG